VFTRVFAKQLLQLRENLVQVAQHTRRIPYDAKPYLKLAPSNQFVSVELTYRDGSVSEIRSFRR
jgi:hypothetical protein